jgi:hypothetical protein
VRGGSSATSLRIRETEVRISVEDSESDPAYRPVPDLQVRVLKPGVLPALTLDADGGVAADSKLLETAKRSAYVRAGGGE